MHKYNLKLLKINLKLTEYKIKIISYRIFSLRVPWGITLWHMNVTRVILHGTLSQEIRYK